MAQRTSNEPILAGAPDSAGYRRVLEALTGIPATAGNRVTVLRNGDAIFPAMLDAVERARHSVDFMTYIYRTGDIAHRFAAALADRARDGVRVRVLLDAFGSRPMDPTLVAELAPGARLADETRRPARELLPQGAFEQDEAEEDFPAEALEALEEQMIAFEQRWVDEPVPLLGGMTPRQARDDPTRRDQLLALLAEMDQTTAGLPGGARGMEPDRIRRTLGLA